MTLFNCFRISCNKKERKNEELTENLAETTSLIQKLQSDLETADELRRVTDADLSKVIQWNKGLKTKLDELVADGKIKDLLRLTSEKLAVQREVKQVVQQIEKIAIPQFLVAKHINQRLTKDNESHMKAFASLAIKANQDRHEAQVTSERLNQQLEVAKQQNKDYQDNQTPFAEAVANCLQVLHEEARAVNSVYRADLAKKDRTIEGLKRKVFDIEQAREIDHEKNSAAIQEAEAAIQENDDLKLQLEEANQKIEDSNAARDETNQRDQEQSRMALEEMRQQFQIETEVTIQKVEKQLEEANQKNKDLTEALEQTNQKLEEAKQQTMDYQDNQTQFEWTIENIVDYMKKLKVYQNFITEKRQVAEAVATSLQMQLEEASAEIRVYRADLAKKNRTIENLNLVFQIANQVAIETRQHAEKYYCLAQYDKKQADLYEKHVAKSLQSLWFYNKNHEIREKALKRKVFDIEQAREIDHEKNSAAIQEAEAAIQENDDLKVQLEEANQKIEDSNAARDETNQRDQEQSRMALEEMRQQFQIETEVTIQKVEKQLEEANQKNKDLTEALVQTNQKLEEAKQQTKDYQDNQTQFEWTIENIVDYMKKLKVYQNFITEKRQVAEAVATSLQMQLEEASAEIRVYRADLAKKNRSIENLNLVFQIANQVAIETRQHAEKYYCLAQYDKKQADLYEKHVAKSLQSLWFYNKNHEIREKALKRKVFDIEQAREIDHENNSAAIQEAEAAIQENDDLKLQLELANQKLEVANQKIEDLKYELEETTQNAEEWMLQKDEELKKSKEDSHQQLEDSKEDAENELDKLFQLYSERIEKIEVEAQKKVHEIEDEAQEKLHEYNAYKSKTDRMINDMKKQQCSNSTCNSDFKNLEIFNLKKQLSEKTDRLDMYYRIKKICMDQVTPANLEEVFNRLELLQKLKPVLRAIYQYMPDEDKSEDLEAIFEGNRFSDWVYDHDMPVN